MREVLIVLARILESLREGLNNIVFGYAHAYFYPSSKVLAFAFSLSAEIERSMISSRTREALHRKKAEGAKLGRPKGSFSKQTKLTGKEEDIKELIKSKVSDSAIARIMKVNRVTLTKFVNSRGLRNSF